MSTLLDAVLWMQRAVIVACSLLIAVTFGVVVVLRYGFQANLFAYEEWLLVVAFLLYFIGGAQGSYERSHIRADLIEEWIHNRRTRWAFALFVLALEVAVGVMLAWWGFQMLATDLGKAPQMPATAVYGIPLAVPRGAIFVGFFLMTAYTLIHFLRRLVDGPPTAAKG